MGSAIMPREMRGRALVALALVVLAPGCGGHGTPHAGASGGVCATGASYTGGLTYYTETAANACGQPWPDAWSVDTGFPAVAMNTALFDEGSAVSACNKC